MNEKELAAELQAAKGDPSEWEEVQPTQGKTGKRRLSAMVSVRLSADELEHVQQRAEEAGQTVSAYLRGLAVRDAERRVYGPTTHPFVQVEGGPYSTWVRGPDVTYIHKGFRSPIEVVTTFAS